jgi:small subunit ribosomal protein S8
MHSDPIADILTRIKNGLAVKKETVVLPFSKINLAILKILKENYYLQDVKIIEEETKIEAWLAYDKVGKSKINYLKRVSKPGRKIYVGKDEIPYVLQGYGLAILSTNKGLMTDKQARAAKVGGEVICEVY